MSDETGMGISAPDFLRTLGENIAPRIGGLRVDRLHELVTSAMTPNPMDAEQQKHFESMDMLHLRELRNQFKASKEFSDMLAPFEHRAEAREMVSATKGDTLDSIKMIGSLAAAIPGYQLGKLTGVTDLVGFTDKSTSPPSAQQLTQGFAGIADGINELLK